jgi:hypothetical protein
MKEMKYKGFRAQIMRAQRLIGSGVHGLPPGSPIDVFPVDSFERPLDHWMKGPGNYVVPVNADWGLWFNWTQNDHMNTAVLLSIKGMNPITGQRSNGFALERYEEKCSIHGEKFQDGLFCEKCNYRWPEQNYVAFPNTLWWDGFRSADGKVRQFFFTEDLAKSIPELVIGKEDTIPAFGFAFFQPKVRRETKFQMRGSGIGGQSLSCGSFDDVKAYYAGGIITPSSSNHYLGQSVDYSVSENSTNYSLTCSNACSVSSSADSTVKSNSVLKLKKSVRSIQAEVGVGAGAEISQELSLDPLKLSDWEDEPASVMRLYFVFIEQFEEIKNRGLRDLTGEKEGYLANLPVG